MSALALGSTLAVGLAAPAPAEASGGTPFFTSGNVFVEGEGGYTSMIIPGILAVPGGRVFAYTDGRFGEPDGSPSDAILKVSDDGGVTWGPLQIMASGAVGGVPTLNVTQPSMIRDRVSGRIFYFYTVRGSIANPADPNLGQIYVRTSTDNGDTFGAPTLVSNVLAAADAAMKAAIIAGTAPPQFATEDPNNYAREFFVIGPGSPIQLTATNPYAPNRLIMSVFALQSRTGATATRGYGDMMLISDDGGLTWTAGGIVPVGAYLSNENSIVELSTGKLYLNQRLSVGDDKRRTFSRSASGGDNWLTPALIPETVLPRYGRVHTGLLRLSFPATDPNGANRILISFPNDLTMRSKLVVAVSYDDHGTFTAGKIVVKGNALYSNMALNSDGTILLAYTADVSGGRKFIVARFNLEWLTDGADSLADGPDVVVDDRSTGYSETGPGWAYGTSATEYWSMGYRFDGGSGAEPANAATFAPTLPVDGTYNVYMRWEDGSTTPDAAPVAVHYAGDTLVDNVTINQRTNGGKWNLIGTYAMEAGSADRVVLSAADAGFTMSDAVRFEYVGP